MLKVYFNAKHGEQTAFLGGHELSIKYRKQSRQPAANTVTSSSE